MVKDWSWEKLSKKIISVNIKTKKLNGLYFILFFIRINSGIFIQLFHPQDKSILFTI